MRPDSVLWHLHVHRDNGIVTDEQARMDQAVSRLSPDRCTRDTTPVTYAHARDLTYGSQELRPPCNQRKPAAAGTTASGSEPSSGSERVSPDCLRKLAAGRGAGADSPGNGGDSGELSELALKPGTESVKAARDFTAETLRGWHLDGLIEDAVIIASELVTNAIRYGAAAADTEDRPAVELAWERFASRVTCVVTDASTRPPVLSAADMSAETGRGLQVVHALAAAWGWMMLGAREKAVWATLLLPPSR